jgi:hypothetical protein
VLDRRTDERVSRLRPTSDVQQRLRGAFVEIRLSCRNGDLKRAQDIADAFHNLRSPTNMLGAYADPQLSECTIARLSRLSLRRMTMTCPLSLDHLFCESKVCC